MPEATVMAKQIKTKPVFDVAKLRNAAGDKVFERDGAQLIVDKKSFLYLNGSELDYSEELMASGFKVVNPNAKRTCGCGESFVV